MTKSDKLPDNWTQVNLEDCVDILDSRRIPINSSERAQRIAGKSESELIPYYGATGQVGWIDDYLFDEELVLLGEDGAPFLKPLKSKAYIIRGKSWVNNHAHVLCSKAGILYNSFLKYYLDVFDYHNYVTGTTRLKLNQARMRKIPVILPPLPEQKRIVAKIDELFTQLEAGVAELRQAKAQLKRYRQAVLKAAVEGELTREWREAHQDELEPAEALLARILAERRSKWEAYQWQKEIERAQKKAAQAQRKAAGRLSRIRDLEPEEWRNIPKDEYSRYLPKNDKWKAKYKEPEPLDTDALPDLPEGWVWAYFDQLLLRLKNGFFGGRPATEPPGVPLLRISAVRPMSVSFESLRYIREISKEKLKNYRIKSGDLLFTRYNGNPNLVGACGMVRKISKLTLYPDKLIRAEISQSLIKPGFLEIYFATNIARQFINPRIKSTAGQNGIAGNDLRDIPVIIPPKDEQRRIIEKVERRLSVADEIERQLDQATMRTERLRQSILKRAFEGKLVEQRAEDGSASILLERVKMEKSKGKDSKTKPTGDISKQLELL